jgi:carboxymethylenebutenolidase
LKKRNQETAMTASQNHDRAGKKFEIEKKNVTIGMVSGSCDCYFASPKGSREFPGVLFYMDGFGLRPWIHEMVDTIAAQGFSVLAPNLFYWYRPAPVLDLKFPLQVDDMPKARELLMPLIQSFDYSKARSDAGSFLDWLGNNPKVKKSKIGVVGYCMGGGLAIRTAAAYPEKIGAVASYHAGRLVSDAPDSPHQLLKHIKSDIYVAHADQDPSMPAEQIEQFNKAVESSGLKSCCELYARAKHGFTMADLPVYSPEALQRHWSSLFELFARTLR